MSSRVRSGALTRAADGCGTSLTKRSRGGSRWEMNELSLMARASRTGTAIDDIDSLIEWALMNIDCCVFSSDPIQGGEKRVEGDTSVASSASGINQT